MSSENSEWNAMGGCKWKLFDQNENGAVLYPIHDVCLTIMGKVCHSNSCQPKYGGRFTSVRDSYQAVCHLHLRNTTCPYTAFPDPGGDWSLNVIGYGTYGLEWEHENYGARDFANGSIWECQDGWEVSPNILKLSNPK